MSNEEKLQNLIITSDSLSQAIILTMLKSAAQNIVDNPSQIRESEKDGIVNPDFIIYTAQCVLDKLK